MVVVVACMIEVPHDCEIVVKIFVCGYIDRTPRKGASFGAGLREGDCFCIMIVDSPLRMAVEEVPFEGADHSGREAAYLSATKRGKGRVSKKKATNT